MSADTHTPKVLELPGARVLHAPKGRCCNFFAGFLVLYSSVAFGGYKDDVGHTQLAGELGAATPTGNGVDVTQIEADATNDDPDIVITYSPDPGISEFSGKTISDVTATSTAFSGHATSVGQFFYGNSLSVAPDLINIESYLAGDWLGVGFVRAGQSGPGAKPQPDISSSRISNHSWVGQSNDNAVNSDILRRIDWIIEQDEFIQVVGTNNGAAVKALLSSAFNAVSVGRTDGGHAMGTVAVDAIYSANRTRPDIVAPASVTSTATPMVASAVAVLVETGNSTPGLSADPVITSMVNRNGDIIYNAERSEVIKAALMAGAERVTNNTTTADITDYRSDVANQTDNGLDKRFGAGQLNIYNSYNIIAGGEQNSIEDAVSTGGQIATSGFDYDPSFGGSGGSNSVASYFISTGNDAVQLTLSMVWNIKIDGGNINNFNDTATLYDLDLFLYDITGAASVNDWVLLGSSESPVENTENLQVTLGGSKDYAIQVKPGSAQTPFEWDYALAWQVTPVDQDGDGVADAIDNCINVANTGQQDTDGDGHGNICDADFDQSCNTNFDDFFHFSSAWLTVSPLHDLNSSGGPVNFGDFFFFSSMWLQSPGPSASGSLCNP